MNGTSRPTRADKLIIISLPGQQSPQRSRMLPSALQVTSRQWTGSCYTAVVELGSTVRGPRRFSQDGTLRIKHSSSIGMSGPVMMCLAVNDGLCEQLEWL